MFYALYKKGKRGIPNISLFLFTNRNERKRNKPWRGLIRSLTYWNERHKHKVGDFLACFGKKYYLCKQLKISYNES